jgi:SpoVK/Ycf46/Vps4 family AAA+-type ATPase
MELKCSTHIWRSSKGLYEISQPKQAQKNLNNPLLMVQYLHDEFRDGPAVIILEDISPYLNNPQILRYLKDIGDKSQKTRQDQNWCQIVVLDSDNPPDAFVGMELDLPDREEIGTIVDGMLKALPEEVQEELGEDDETKLNGRKDEIVDSLTGLESQQVQQAVAQSLVQTKAIDVKILIDAKKNLISGSKSLQWEEPDPRGLDSVGGLRILKDYLTEREKAFKDAIKGTIPKPKGMANTGIPGVGKSLVARSVATAWRVPLLRMDIGDIFQKFLGDSEKEATKGLKIAEAIAPCILWVDEVEKAMAGVGGSGESDGGVMSRIFGKFLTWMQENPKPVYIIVTANEPAKLPSEFWRSGRFDIVWFVDVPNKKDRIETTEILLKKHNVFDISNVDPSEVAEATKNFTGAEIEQAIVESIWVQHFKDVKGTNTEAIIKASQMIKPVIEGWGKRGTLKEVRDWAKDAAQPANEPEEETIAVEDYTRVVGGL